MYGLKGAVYLANQESKRVLSKEGYVTSKFIPGLLAHKTKDIEFSLVVDDFDVKYTKNKDAEYIFQTVQERYPEKADWSPIYYLGITLGLHYVNRTFIISMPGYVRKALLNFNTS